MTRKDFKYLNHSHPDFNAHTIPTQTFNAYTIPTQTFNAYTIPTQTVNAYTISTQTVNDYTIPTQTVNAYTIPTQTFWNYIRGSWIAFYVSNLHARTMGVPNNGNSLKTKVQP